MGTSHSISNPRPESDPDVDDGLASIVGYPGVAQRLRSIVVNPVSSAWAGDPAVVPPAGVLIYGPPGPAAAILRDALCRELGAGRVTFAGVDELDPLPVGPTVIDVDVIDGLHLRGDDGVLGAMFERLESAPNSARPLPIAISVAPWHLDQRLLVRGRFDRLVFVPPPGWEARTAALEGTLAETRPDLLVRVPLLVAATVGWSGADLDELLEALAAGPVARDGSEIDRSSSLLDVMSSVVPRTRSWAGRVRELVDQRGDEMLDDLVAWLRRAE